ncbi:MAG TPA: hypothetical protein VK666_31015 [Chryseolinea sp.]|nr:hypothetical protein [Chryseolinea sp.]
MKTLAAIMMLTISISTFAQHVDSTNPSPGIVYTAAGLPWRLLKQSEINRSNVQFNHVDLFLSHTNPPAVGNKVSMAHGASEVGYVYVNFLRYDRDSVLRGRSHVYTQVPTYKLEITKTP